MEEIGNRPDCRRRSVVGTRGVGLQVGPCRGDKRTASIRKNKAQEQYPVSVCLVVYLQGLPLEGVLLTNDRDFRGQILDVGSMS